MIRDRDTLKAFFKQGQRPTEGNFVDLIDSMYNKLDDDLMAAFLDNNQLTKVTFAEIVNTPLDGLKFVEASTKNTLLSIKPGGNVGIATSTPRYTLDVNGTVASVARVGTYADKSIDPSTVFADGKWHKIISSLDGLNIFEVVASAKGIKGAGNYALLHANVLSTFGNSKSKVVQSTARYKGICRNISLRWTGTLNNYNLEIRTSKNFGAGVKINFFVTKLLAE
jgi:hypothetical protein